MSEAPLSSIPTAGSEDAPGARLSVELQLSYATGVVAGTSMAAYQVVMYGRESGFSTVWVTYMACAFAMVLEMVTAGMVLHIMYRGFWIAMRLLVETRSDEGLATAELAEQWESEIRGLDAKCQSLFFRTFRFLYIGMIISVGAVGVRLLNSPSTFRHYIGLALLGLLFLMPLARLARRFAGSGRPGSAVQAVVDRLVRVRRFLGLWWVQSDAKAVSPVTVIGFCVLANLVVGLNLGLMTTAELTADKPVYYQSAHDKIVLSFRHGGYIPDSDESTVTLKASASGFRTTMTTDVFSPLAPGHYAAVLDAADFRPGAASVQVELRIHYKDNNKSLSIVPDPASANFLVAK